MQRHKAFLRFLLGAAAAVGLFAGARGADAAEPYRCPTVFAGVAGEGRCTDHPEPHPARADSRDIVRAKTDAANVYARYRQGEATFADVRRADDIVNRLTGEVSTARSTLAATTAPGAGGAVLRDYLPFRQINAYYCGPATVQSILWQLRSSERGIREEGSSEVLTLTGDPSVDQPRLATDRWLATESYGGTPWGDAFIPRTLNTWLGTHWYVSSGTPNAGGDLTAEQALRNIQYAVDRGYPVAANAVYGPETYYPAGFYPGITYYHWDTIYGYRQNNGRATVSVGQVYGSDGLEYQPLQQVAWETEWKAIGSWYGIVW